VILHSNLQEKIALVPAASGRVIGSIPRKAVAINISLRVRAFRGVYLVVHGYSTGDTSRIRRVGHVDIADIGVIFGLPKNALPAAARSFESISNVATHGSTSGTFVHTGDSWGCRPADSCRVGRVVR